MKVAFWIFAVCTFLVVLGFTILDHKKTDDE